MKLKAVEGWYNRFVSFVFKASQWIGNSYIAAHLIWTVTGKEKYSWKRIREHWKLFKN